MFWKECLEMFNSPVCHSKFVIGFFMAANAFLTSLQFLWGKTIIGFILPKKKSTDKGSKKDASKSVADGDKQK